MPTGYTSKIADGISFKEFVLICSRNFGANIQMRDEPLGIEIKEYEPNKYYVNKLNETKEKYKNFLDMDSNELIELWNEEYQEDVKWRVEANAKNKDLKNKYETMLEKVNAFIPPTEDHINLKNFMIDQLEKSIKFDCHEHEIPEQVDFNVWYDDKISGFERDINHYERDLEDEKIRIEGANLWNQQLKESLENVE